MEKTDFSAPRRMSWSAFVIFFVKALKYFSGFFIPYFIILFIGKENSFSILETIWRMLLLVAVIIGASAVMALVKYRFRKFCIEDGNLIMTYGFLRRETTSIPLSKIHSLRTKRGFMYRLLDMRGISVDTLASKNEEVELILDDEDWEALMARIECQETSPGTTMPENGMPDAAEQECDDAPDRQTISGDISGNRSGSISGSGQKEFRFSNLNLVKGALCQNHLKGMAVLSAVMAALYNTILSVDDRAIKKAIDYADAHAADSLDTITVSAVLTVAAILYLISMLLWVGKVFLRYYGMTVRTDGDQLFFESGLVSRSSSRFPRNRVCSVYVKRNLPEKMLGCCTLQLKQAMNASEGKGVTEIRIYGSDSASSFLEWWLGKDSSDSAEIMSARSGRGLILNTMKIDIILSLTATAVLFFTGLYPWIALPACYLLISLAKGICAARRSRITLKEDYIRISNGRFADISNYIRYRDIEVVRLRRTPFTPFTGRVMLTVSTNGTSFTIRSLLEAEAKDIMEYLLAAV